MLLSSPSSTPTAGLRGRIRAIVNVHVVFVPSVTLFFDVALGLSDPRDRGLAVQAGRLVDDLAGRALPLIVVAVPAHEVRLEGDLALVASGDVDGAIVGEAHPEPLGLAFEVWLAEELDCEVRVVFEQGEQFVLLPEEVEVLNDEVHQDFAGQGVLRGGDLEDDFESAVEVVGVLE